MEESLRRGLRDVKYVEGRDFIIEHRTAKGQVDKLPSLAEELVRLKVDVIVTATDETTLAAKHATSTIPIVTILYNSPMSIGLVESLNQPTGNITGIYARQTELAGKRLELLKEVVSHLSRVGVSHLSRIDASRRIAVDPNGSLPQKNKPAEARLSWALSS